MTLSIETIIGLITLVISGIALFFSLRKQEKEEKNIDADTISKLYATINEQEERHQNLKDEFEAYKKAMSAQIAYLSNQNARLEAWARRLVRQLEDANIKPCEFE